MISAIALLSAVTVSTKAQLHDVISRARGGEVIRLARGNYGVAILVDRNFTKPVTIESSNPASPAIFSDLRMRNVNNITFKNIEFTRNRGSDPDWAKMVDINGGTGISFINSFVHGPANGWWQDDMYGMYIRNTKNLRISGVAFHDLRVALVVEDSSGFNIENNMFTQLSMDAMQIPGAIGGRIFNNSVALFRVMPGGHPDGIQCWTAGKTTGCKNVQIIMNRFMGTPGNEFQGIFFGDEAQVGGYDDIQIIGNSFANVMWHGINITGSGTGVVISNNIITAGPNYRSWIRTSGPASLSGNRAPEYIINGKSGPPPGNTIGGLFKSN